MFLLFYLRILGPPRSSLFPCTTLFRAALHGRRSVEPHSLRSEGRPLPGDRRSRPRPRSSREAGFGFARRLMERDRSEEHTSELQSRQYLVCRLLLEKNRWLWTMLRVNP